MLSTTYGISLLHQSRVVKIGYAIFGVSECECTTTWVVDRVWAHVHLFICGSKRLDAFLDQDFPWGSSARLIHEHMLRKWVSDSEWVCSVYRRNAHLKCHVDKKGESSRTNCRLSLLIGCRFEEMDHCHLSLLCSCRSKEVSAQMQHKCELWRPRLIAWIIWIISGKARLILIVSTTAKCDMPCGSPRGKLADFDF